MTGEGLTLAVVSDAAGLEALAPQWDALVLAAERPSPFLLHAWVSAWWRHFGEPDEGAELAVVTAHRGGELAGIAPMFIGRRRGLRTCRFLGGHESALGDMLLARRDDEAVAEALLERLAQSRFDYLDVFGVPGGGVFTRLASAHRLADLPRVDAPVLRMPDGWEAAYAERTGSKKRALHRRRARQLAALGTLAWTTARTPDEVDLALDAAFDIHARRWQGRPDGSTFGQSASHPFHREAAQALAAQGRVRIMTLRIDGRPVAFHYWILVGSTMYVHRLAFDPDLSRFSPGQVTLLRAISDASDEGARRVEFLGGNERYKLELADACEPLHQIVGLQQTLLAQVATRALLFSLAARMRLKQSPVLHRLYLEGLSPLRRMAGRSAAQPPA